MSGLHCGDPGERDLAERGGGHDLEPCDLAERRRQQLANDDRVVDDEDADRRRHARA